MITHGGVAALGAEAFGEGVAMKRACAGPWCTAAACVRGSRALGRPAESAWPMCRHTAHHTGLSRFAGPSMPPLSWSHALYSFDSVGTLVWSYKAAGSVYSSHAIVGDWRICVGSADDTPYCIGPTPTPTPSSKPHGDRTAADRPDGGRVAASGTVLSVRPGLHGGRIGAIVYAGEWVHGLVHPVPWMRGRADRRVCADSELPVPGRSVRADRTGAVRAGGGRGGHDADDLVYPERADREELTADCIHPSQEDRRTSVPRKRRVETSNGGPGGAGTALRSGIAGKGKAG